MSSGVLVVAEHLRGGLSDTTRQAVAAGKELKDAGAGQLAVALISRDPELVKQASLEGVDLIIQVPVSEDEFNGDLYAAAVEALVKEKEPSIVLMGFTTNGMTVAPVVASRMGLGLASDVLGCSIEDGKVVARRQFYGGKVEAELEFPDDAAVMLLLRPSIWSAATVGGAPEITSFDAGVDDSGVRVHHREFIDPPTDDLDISKADIILAIGRGIGERENIPRVEALASQLGATLAGSRPLIDAGWLSKARQVGQSGVTVKPKLYIALGISGAVQHLAGMRGSETILAVNQDPNAPIFSVATYGAVADVLEVIDELENSGDEG
jgi:electron transfer flavoprotein alpha subunit